MRYTLIVSIYLMLNQKKYNFPFRQIQSKIKEQYGIHTVFELPVAVSSYEIAVFNLLEKLETFGYD